ncbi:MAG TPA: GWxTD domain-containing protein [Candidatus Acidoferrales bacterium]|nr:GWxTD domain-containing protein [Candidatus Acidoferrales bacterium]
MKCTIRVFTVALITAGLAFPALLLAQEQQSKPRSKAEQKKSERALLKEIDTPYKEWLQKEVVYIITDEERAAFLRLSTNEEREQFIEQFWLRRDPTPDTIENEYKEEHYRRIAYANERFASGVPGWKTDRGRIYIAWGPPDEIESHPTGGAYVRPVDEGGGETSTYSFEKWRYRYLEGIGTDVNLEFVDQSGSNEYKISIDPADKDALLMIPGAGLTDMEAMGVASKADRFTNPDGTRLGRAMGVADPTRHNMFDKLDLMAKIFRPPAVKFKDLEEVVNFRLIRNQIHFEYRFDYLRITGDTVLVPITVQIPNHEMTYKATEGVHSAALNIYARITTMTGRIVHTFEDVVNRDFPESLLQASLKGLSVYQKAVPLRPGLYKLDLVIKDVNSGNVGVINSALRVPRYEENQLAASTLILADQIERVPARQIGMGQFVIGASKVRPRMDSTFRQDDRMGIYLQIYNLGIDETTHKSLAAIEYRIRQGDKEVVKQTETSDQLQQGGEQLTLEKMISLASLAPGKYKIEVQVTDNVRATACAIAAQAAAAKEKETACKKTISPTAEFTVKAAEKAPAKPAGNE